MHPKELTPMQALKRSLQLVAQAAPIELRRLALLNLLTGAGPSASLFLGKVVIDEASALIEQGGVENPLAVTLGNSRLLWSVAIALGLNLIVDSVDAVGSSLFASLRDRVEGFVRGQVLDKVAYIGITAFGGEQGSEINCPDYCDGLHHSSPSRCLACEIDR